jgi:LacI family transcriptional regulator
LIESSRNYGRGILRGIAHYAHVHGPWSLYAQERQLHSGIPDWLQKWEGDGIIARIENKRTARALLKFDCPVIDVLGSAHFNEIPGFDTDAVAVARMAAGFLLNAGFRHFAYCGYRGIPFSDRREAAFVEFMSDAGHKVSVLSSLASEFPDSHIQAVEQRGLGRDNAVAQWLDSQPRPLGLFACNDIRAQQMLNVCREQGIKVPEEIAVIGVDNDDVLCDLCEPPLTSIEPDTERIGYEAAGLLDKLMRRGRARTGITQVPPLRIVERASTDVVPIEDSITVTAVRFIRDNVNNGIAVKDVLNHMQRSRTDLEQRFRRWLKTSIRSEIQRRRMDRVCHLLQETDLDLNRIAEGSGFASASHLCRLFQKSFRKTPTAYRLECKVRQ